MSAIPGNHKVKGNPLNWWRSHGGAYTQLSKVARGLLAITATSVPSERVFSLAGHVVTAKRNCLLPENVDRLVFLNIHYNNVSK